MLIQSAERLTGQRHLEGIYHQIKRAAIPGADFFEAAVRAGGINVIQDGIPESSLPRQGPLIFVAIHPFGIVDGLLLHARLCQDQELGEYFLPIDFTESRTWGNSLPKPTSHPC